jgi:hypothetical protein
MVEPERPQITLRRMRVECWISKTTSAQEHEHVHAPGHLPPHTHTCNTVFPLQQWFRERASMLRYPYIGCFVV